MTKMGTLSSYAAFIHNIRKANKNVKDLTFTSEPRRTQGPGSLSMHLAAHFSKEPSMEDLLATSLVVQ